MSTATPLPPGREEFRLRFGPYVATLTRIGAALTSLTCDGRPLVLDCRSALASGVVPAPRYTGAVLAPWPNRIRDGRYAFDGQRHQLSVTEIGRGCALHGLVLWQAWDVVEVTPDSVTLSCCINPQPGYPFTVEVTAAYRLSDSGLRIELSAANLGATRAPAGLSIHPYVVPGSTDTPMDEWTLTLPMDSVLEVEPDRLLPRTVRDVAGTAFDFRQGRALDGATLDNAFTAASGRGATLAGPDGFTVTVGWDAGCPWLQVCTIDGETTQWRRAGVAIEPMTCPPDAFNSGVDLWILAPGERRGTVMSIAASG